MLNCVYGVRFTSSEPLPERVGELLALPGLARADDRVGDYGGAVAVLERGAVRATSVSSAIACSM